MADCKKRSRLSKTDLKLAFAATCVEALARTLSVSYYEAFRLLKDANLFETRIFPFYEVLHSESREVVVQRLIEEIPQLHSTAVDKPVADDKISQADIMNDAIIQEIVMSNLIGMVTAALAKKMKVSPQKAFDMFYESDTCRRLHDKSTGLYLFGHLYIANDFMREHQYP